MRVVLSAVLSLSLASCAAGPGRDATAECAAQGHQPGTEASRVCMEAGGAAIATGPGSPFAYVDEEQDPNG